MISERGDSEDPVDGERSQTLLPEPDFLPDPVFPKENYLESVGVFLFRKMLFEMNVPQLIDQMRKVNASQQVAMFIAESVGFWAIDLDVTSDCGITGRQEFASRIREPIRRPPVGMATFAAEQEIVAKGVVQIQVEHEIGPTRQYELCQLRTIGWYAARLISPTSCA